MKHILFLCSSHGFEDGRVSQKEAVSFANLGYKISMCGQRAEWRYDAPVRMIDVDTCEVIADWHNAGFPGFATRGQRFRRLRNLWRVAKREHADLHVAHELESALIAMFFKWIYRTPFVFDVHENFDLNIVLAFPRLFRPLVKVGFWLVMKCIVRNAAGITAVAPNNQIYLYAKLIGKPVAILHNSPRLEYFPFCEEETDPITIVHEGRLGVKYGSREALEALKILKDKGYSFKFLLIGWGSIETRESFVEKVREYGLEDRVIINGLVPWRELGALECKGQIGIVCCQPVGNSFVTLANKLYNYMACGLAVVGMKNSLTEEIITDAKSGLCAEITDPFAIADAIAWLIDHPGDRRQMARNGRKAIEERYGWHCMEELMREFYGNLLKHMKDEDEVGILKGVS